MIDLQTRQRIHHLIGEGVSQKEIAARLGVSRRSVSRIAHEGNGAPPKRPVGRPSKTRPYAPLVQRRLTRSPQTAARDLYEMALTAGYDGSRAAFYRMIRMMRDGDLP